MAADGPLYTSGVFIGWVTVAVALIGIAGTIVTWRRGISRRKLMYSTEVTSLIATRTAGRDPKLSVIYDGRPLTDPYLITLRLVSRSWRDIGNDDFNGGEPLIFDLQAPIIAPLGDTEGMTGPRGPGAGPFVRILPRKISRGEVLRLDFMTDGRPRILPPQNPLLNVDIVDEDKTARRRPLIGAAVFFSGLACLLVAGAITVVDPHGPHAVREAFAIVGGTLVLSSYFFDDRLRFRSRAR